MPAVGPRQNWESLRVFAACAEHLSFTQAAAELGLTQAAVSQRIGELERRLGLRLFVRRPRLRLTAHGERLAPRLAQGFSAIERALRELRAPRLLSLTTTVSFATLWLLPRLPQLRRHDPDLSLALDVADEFRPLEDGRHDLAIRGFHGDAPPASARPCGRLWRPFAQTITEGGYYLVWRKDRDDDPLIGSFRRWILAALAAESAGGP